MGCFLWLPLTNTSSSSTWIANIPFQKKLAYIDDFAIEVGFKQATAQWYMQRYMPRKLM